MRAEKEIVCRWCGNTFTGTNYNSKYCSDECRRLANNKHSRENKLIRKGKIYKADHTSVNEIAKAAAERGMSYGQYVGQLFQNRHEASEPKRGDSQK